MLSVNFNCPSLFFLHFLQVSSSVSFHKSHFYVSHCQSNVDISNVWHNCSLLKWNCHRFVCCKWRFSSFSWVFFGDSRWIDGKILKFKFIDDVTRRVWLLEKFLLAKIVEFKLTLKEFSSIKISSPCLIMTLDNYSKL